MLTIRTFGIRSLFQPESAKDFCYRNHSSGYFISYNNLVIIPSPEIDTSFPITTSQPNKRSIKAIMKATAGEGGGGGVSSVSKEDEYGVNGVSLGTMKLPLDTNLARFEALLFQWANSLCQGANLPMPMPLKVDKINGGARIGFMTIGDDETEVLVYIDFLVFPPSTDNSGPVFRAIRNGLKKAETPPGEPRIMRSLLAALKKSVDLARA